MFEITGSFVTYEQQTIGFRNDVSVIVANKQFLPINLFCSCSVESLYLILYSCSDQFTEIA